MAYSKVNPKTGQTITESMLSMFDDGIASAHVELQDIGANYRPNLNKSALVKVISFPLSVDLIDNGARIQFNNIHISCMGSLGKFELDIPESILDFAHGQSICVDTSSRAPNIIFIQPDWPEPEEATKWAIGSMTTNAVIINGTATQRKIVTIYGAGSITRDYT